MDLHCFAISASLRRSGLLVSQIVANQTRTHSVLIHVEQAFGHRGNTPGFWSPKQLSLRTNVRSFRRQIEPNQCTLGSDTEERSIDMQQTSSTQAGVLKRYCRATFLSRIRCRSRRFPCPQYRGRHINSLHEQQAW